MVRGWVRAAATMIVTVSDCRSSSISRSKGPWRHTHKPGAFCELFLFVSIVFMVSSSLSHCDNDLMPSPRLLMLIRLRECTSRKLNDDSFFLSLGHVVSLLPAPSRTLGAEDCEHNTVRTNATTPVLFSLHTSTLSAKIRHGHDKRRGRAKKQEQKSTRMAGDRD